MDSDDLLLYLDCILKPKQIPYAVIASNEFQSLNFKKFPFYLIFNTLPRNRKVGHWIAALFCQRRHGIYVEVFDPLGKPLKTYGVEPNFFVEKENLVPIQSESSDDCGTFCLYWLYYRLRNLTTTQFVKHFYRNTSKNDIIAEKFLKKIKRCCKQQKSFSSNAMCSVSFDTLKSCIKDRLTINN